MTFKNISSFSSDCKFDIVVLNKSNSLQIMRIDYIDHALHVGCSNENVTVKIS